MVSEIQPGPVPAAGGPAPEVTLPPADPASDAQRIAQLMQIATEHEQAGRLADADSILRQIIAEAGDHPPALHLMGIVAFKMDRVDEAVRLIERSLALAPMEALYYRNICEVYRVLGRLDEALAAGRRAATLAPNDVHCHHNLGVLQYHRLELDEAIASGERAIALSPDFAGAHFGIAEASLLRGDFARGWEEYEWRMKLANAPPLLPPTERPQWDGSPIPDGTLLLIADQGYGDVIQFARYIPWAAGRCAKLAIACSAELHPVIELQAGAKRQIGYLARYIPRLILALRQTHIQATVPQVGLFGGSHGSLVGHPRAGASVRRRRVLRLSPLALTFTPATVHPQPKIVIPGSSRSSPGMTKREECRAHRLPACRGSVSTEP